MTTTIHSSHAETSIDKTRTERPTVEVVALPERFDAFSAADLLDGVPASSVSIMVDGRAVRFADMQALQTLVDARLRALDSGGELLIGAPSNELRATLELTGFDELLSVVLGGSR